MLLINFTKTQRIFELLNFKSESYSFIQNLYEDGEKELI